MRNRVRGVVLVVVVLVLGLAVPALAIDGMDGPLTAHLTFNCAPGSASAIAETYENVQFCQFIPDQVGAQVSIYNGDGRLMEQNQQISWPPYILDRAYARATASSTRELQYYCQSYHWSRGGAGMEIYSVVLDDPGNTLSVVEGSSDVPVRIDGAAAAKAAAAKSLSSYRIMDPSVHDWTAIAHRDTPIVLRELLGRKSGGLLDITVHVGTDPAMREGDTLPWVLLSPLRDTAKVVHSHKDGTHTVFTLKLVDDNWVIDGQVELVGK